ncbi:MAG TPA: helix-turn-helix transcriptional regulator [Thermoanaerobaculia bacterium]|nr:helix-turn-helix transcriptional regulator [Thermoanaerobaculia bacterium]HUM29864.1 helix-turn-helix transcriptional regulator [Thermoanaerobaculia bacterium]HXK68139.1 helix-turn-helix transcriptional regulator [Thermoanaerobaculia bacterium]
MNRVRQARFIGQKIRQLRRSRHLTQVELATKIGVQQSDLSRMEKGEYRVSLDTLFKILQVFEMSMSEFFGEVVTAGASRKEQKVLSAFNALSESDKDEVLEFIRFKRMKEEQQENEDD